MNEVSCDELMGYISMKVFCADHPHRNLALRALAGNIVYHANLDTSKVSRKAYKNTKYFGPAGEVWLQQMKLGGCFSCLLTVTTPGQRLGADNIHQAQLAATQVEASQL